MDGWEFEVEQFDKTDQTQQLNFEAKRLQFTY